MFTCNIAYDGFFFTNSHSNNTDKVLKTVFSYFTVSISAYVLLFCIRFCYFASDSPAAEDGKRTEYAGGASSD